MKNRIMQHIAKEYIEEPEEEEFKPHFFYDNFLWIDGEFVEEHNLAMAIIEYLVKHNKIEDIVRYYYTYGPGKGKLTEEELEQEIDECIEDYGLPNEIYLDLVAANYDKVLPETMDYAVIQKKRGSNWRQRIYYIDSAHLKGNSINKIVDEIKAVRTKSMIIDSCTGEVLYEGKIRKRTSQTF